MDPVQENPRLVELESLLRLTVGDLETMADKIDTQFRKNERALFASEGASGGDKWPELSPAYKAWKRKKFPGRKIMTRTGRLRKSLTDKSNSEHIATYRTSRIETVVEVGTSNPVAAYHIKGNPLSNPRLPERDTLQQSSEQVAGYVAAVREVLTAKLERVARAMAAW